MTYSFYMRETDKSRDCVDLDVNVSSANGVEITGVLGFVTEEGYGEAPADLFVQRGQAWLRAHLGRPDAEREPSWDQEPDRAQFIECGRRAGYLCERIHALVTAVQAHRSTHHIVYWA